jgi:hypothetical protein
MKGLGVELHRKRLDLLRVDPVPAGRKSLPNVQVIEEEGLFPIDLISVRHDRTSCDVTFRVLALSW